LRLLEKKKEKNLCNFGDNRFLWLGERLTIRFRQGLEILWELNVEPLVLTAFFQDIFFRI